MPPAWSDEYAETGTSTPYTLKTNKREQPIVGVSGGKARDLAAVKLGEVFKDSIIVPMSRFVVPLINDYDRDADPPSEHYNVNADYIARHGIEKTRIVPETDSTNILEGLIQMMRICNERGTKNAVFITNDYNVPRARAMLNTLRDRENGVKGKLKYCMAQLREEYKKILGVDVDNNGDAPIVNIKESPVLDGLVDVDIQILAAENVLPHFYPRTEGIIKKVREMPEYKNRVNQELNGANQISDGSYGKSSWEKLFKIIKE